MDSLTVIPADTKVEEEKKTGILPSLLESEAVSPVLDTILLPMLSANTTAILSCCSSSFYRRTLTAHCWENKLLQLGCNPDTLSLLIRAKVIHNYKNMYAQIRRLPPIHVTQLAPWELCCLSGEQHAIEWAKTEGHMTAHSRGINHWTALHYAAFVNIPAFFIYAINTMAISPDARTQLQETPLLLAAKANSLAVVQCAIENLALPTNVRGQYGASLIHYAAWGGALETLAWLLETHHLPAETRDDDQSTLLHYAAWGGSLRTIRYCHDQQSFQCDEKDTNLMNALHYAAWGGQYDAVCLVRYLAHQNRRALRVTAKDITGDNVFWFSDHSPNPQKTREALELDMPSLSRLMNNHKQLSRRERRRIKRAAEQSAFQLR